MFQHSRHLGAFSIQAAKEEKCNNNKKENYCTSHSQSSDSAIFCSGPSRPGWFALPKMKWRPSPGTRRSTNPPRHQAPAPPSPPIVDEDRQPAVRTVVLTRRWYKWFDCRCHRTLDWKGYYGQNWQKIVFIFSYKIYYFYGMVFGFFKPRTETS